MNYPFGKKINNLCLTLYTKTYLITGLNVNAKIINILEQNIEKIFIILKQAKITQVHKALTTKIFYKLDFRINIFWSSKQAINKIKKQVTLWIKYLYNTFHKRLVSRIYKELWKQ